MRDSEVQKAMELLPREIRPQRDLWPGIEGRLQTRGTEGAGDRTPSWFKPALAAAVVVSLTTGIFIGRGIDRSPEATADRPAIEYALLGTVQATEREYQAAFRELVPLNYSGVRLAGEEPRALQASWEDLQQAETSLLAALQQYPEDGYLNTKLMELRSRQLRFVKQLALLEQNSWRNT